MKYKNSIAIIRTRKDNVAGSYIVFTDKYRKLNPNKFDYNGYFCDQFEILETVGGNVVINTVQNLIHSGVKIKNEMQFSNVAEIEILTDYDV